MAALEPLPPDAPAYGHVGGTWHHATRCGGRAHVSRDIPRPTCRCPTPTAPDGICTGCHGSLWDCCGKADSEPHRRTCHTRQHDEGVFACVFDRWDRWAT